jgi:transcriptional regulator with PAS, ATPase and Fis domain
MVPKEPSLKQNKGNILGAIMSHPSWLENIPIAITVSDAEGKIIEMNQKAADTFASSGGKDLIGKNLFDCHPSKAQEKIRQLSQGTTANVYTIEKNGIKKLIYQIPYFQNGKFAGLVEFSFATPDVIPHFIRD